MSSAQPLRVCIIGSGVVGQATGKGFNRRGHQVTFVDTNVERVQRLIDEGLSAYTPAGLREAALAFDIHLFCVPTPTEAGSINLSFLRTASIDLGRRMRTTTHYQVVVVHSTVVPGTTEGMVASLVARYAKKTVGQDFGLCMNPEYLREKTAVADSDQPWLVVIGQGDRRAGDVVAQLYAQFDCPLQRVSIIEAETQKYVHNLYNAVKITFFNEFRAVCRHLGADPDVIFPLVAKSCEGMWNPEYGIRDFGAFDGMCLPKDTQAFLSWATARGWQMPLLATAIASNTALLAAQAAHQPEAAVPVAVPAGVATATVSE
jgi:UDPglucose 6-dehydrogenase